MKQPLLWRLLAILVLALLAAIIDLPGSISWRQKLPLNPDLKTGLDLQGGTHLVLSADMTNIEEADRSTALESVKQVISRRVDLYGVSEPIIQTSVVQSESRLIVELPGISDITQAINLIGQTAQLDFREDLSDLGPLDYASSSAIARIYAFQPTGLTGKDLKKATVSFNQGNSAQSGPVVSLEFTPEGGQKFAQITQRNVQKPLAIFLDNQLVTNPVVNEPILTGQAVISGNFTPESASQLAIQLNAGALPVPVKIIEQKNISATLGADSIQKSLVAGSIGLGLVALFMILLYGFNGFLADVALVIYGLITLAIYKLIPVTLTLPGIAGFILTIGMAVDSNILIFERLKEELRAGRPYAIALELAFGRAWDSIKDANVATIITSLVLINPLNFNFLNSSGLVRGFAITLFIGVIISLFTGIIVTRTLMRLFLIPNTSKVL
ncbi:MAG: protein translocase subunit SecD [Candidatus Beckwithbacteria bacterium]